MTIDRAQSEVVGTVLLIGVVTLTVSVAGVGVLSSMQASTDDPQATLDGRLTGSSLELVHRGGDSLNESELDIRLSNDSTASTVGFEDGEIVAGDSDGEFKRGELWRDTTAIPSDSRLDVWVIHDPTDTILYEDTLYTE